jgi:transcriptional regulator GlxA family with amidase domain
LLENSRMTVEQVAAAVGYQDTTALRRLMKQSTGVPPSRFRSAARPGRQQA